MFVYSCSIKIHASGIEELLESIFLHPDGVEAFSLQKVVEMLEAIVSWQEVSWIWQIRKNFAVQFIQLMKHWLCNMWLDTVMGKNWALSVDWYPLQAIQFLVHLIYLLSILLRCNRQVWSWRTKWSRSKANRVLSSEHTGHSKQHFLTTQETTPHMDITKWSILKSDWLYSLQSKIVKLYTVS